MDALPVILELAQGIHLLRPQVRGDLGRLVANGDVQAVGEAVRRVGADHQRAVTEGGAHDRRRCGDGSLAHSTLARVQDHTHGWPQTARWAQVTARRG